MSKTFVVKDKDHPLYGMRVPKADGSKAKFERVTVTSPERRHLKENPEYRSFKGDSHRKVRTKK